MAIPHLFSRTYANGTYWLDENSNKWNHTDYSYEGALACSMSLKGCYECVNCQDCTNCNQCINCSHCTNCIECSNCFNCTYCNVFDHSHDSFGKGRYLNILTKNDENIWIDNKGNQWTFSYCMTYAEALANYESLSNCENCINCYDCTNCFNCIYCNSCENLVRCSYCNDFYEEEYLYDYISDDRFSFHL